MTEPETKKPRRPKGTGCIFQMKGSPFYWIKYHRNGIPIRESSHSTDKNLAGKLLRKRMGEIAAGIYAGPQLEKIRVTELAEELIREYRVNGRRSIDDLEARWKLHLKPFFEVYRAIEVTSSLVRRYIDQRQQEAAENATINRELSALKRMFNLGHEATPPKVRDVPYIPMLRESNVRTGFLETAQHDKLASECAKLGLWMRAIFEVGYTFGWRHEELLAMRVRQVNLSAGTIRLEPGTTKNREGREVTMTKPIRDLIEQCVLGKRRDDYVFTREDGKRVACFRIAWANVCTAAGLGNWHCRVCGSTVDADYKCATCNRQCTQKRLAYHGLIFHDLRRTAARNLRRAGIAEGVIMKIGGWRTRSVFERYAIVSQTDIADAMIRLETEQERVNSEAPKPASVPRISQNFGQNDGQLADNRIPLQLQTTAGNA